MKDSVLKWAALTLLIVVFAAVVITGQWVDNSACSSVNKPARVTCEIATESGHTQHQTSHGDTQLDTADNWGRITSADMQNNELGGTLEDREQQQRHTDEKPASQPEEEPDDGAEPPDDSDSNDKKDTYGMADVE